MWASPRFVHVLKEGDRMLLFGGPGAPQPPDVEKKNKIKWQYSKRKRILVEDVKNGVVDFDEDIERWLINGEVSTLEEIFTMHPEYADADKGDGGYNLDKFEGRLKAINDKTVEERNCAEEDLGYLEEYMKNNEVSYFNKKGMLQW